MTTPEGPFDVAAKPWLLSRQRNLGIAVQESKDGELTQPHGYGRGSKHTILPNEDEQGGYESSPYHDQGTRGGQNR